MTDCCNTTNNDIITATTRSASFFGYPGGKSKLRGQIIERLELRLGVEFREPFVGGGNVALSVLSRIGSLWLNDRDPALVSLWLSLLQYPAELQSRVRDFSPSIETFHRFRNDLLSLAKVSQRKERLIEAGFRKLAIQRMSFSCLGVKAPPRSDIFHKWHPDYLCERIEQVRLALNHVSVRCTCLDFAELIKDEGEEASLYLDPPYYGRGNDCYLYGFRPADHRRLALMLQHTPHHWVLSYDDCLPVRELYSWAQIERVPVKYTLGTSTTGRPCRFRRELLICPPQHQSVGVVAA